MLLALAVIAAAATIAPPTHAQDYPSHAIKIVVPYPAGGGSDRMARVIAEKLHTRWNQPVVVENRAGAGGNVGAEYVFNARPDGYTLLFAAQVNLVIAKNIYPNLAFDPDAFAPITVVTTSPNILVINPKVPAVTLPQLITYGRAYPNKLNYASTGIGSSQHLAGELLKSLAGIDLVHVPYKGTAPALTDLLAGHVELMFVEISNALPYIHAGNLKAIANAGAARNAALPDLPTMSETLPGFVSMQWTGIVAPPGTPDTITKQVSRAVADALREPDMVQSLKDLSMEAVGSEPDQMAAFMRQERERWGGIIRKIGAAAQ